MGNPLNSDEYIGWFSHLYPSHGYPSLILVSGMIGFGLYALGSVIAAAVSVGYFKDAYPIFSAIGVIVLLVWFGWIDGSYVEAWNEVRSAFAVDDETYESVVRFRLERMYDWRRILMYSSVIAVAYFLVTTLVFVEHVPFHDTASDFIYETGDNPLAEETSRIAYHYLLDASLALVLGTAINIIMNHLALVREISKLPFQNIYNSASELEPIIWVSMVSVTVWFAGISVVVLWTETGISSAVGLTILAFLVFVGVIFILAPKLRLHSALLDAKRDLIADIQKRYQEIDQSTQTETGPSEDLSLRLEVTDRRLENAKSIRTWVYDISSASKLVAASILPWLNLVNGILKFPLFD